MKEFDSKTLVHVEAHLLNGQCPYLDVASFRYAFI